MFKKTVEAWKEFRGLKNRVTQLQLEIHRLKGVLRDIDDVLDVKQAAVSELDVKRNVELAIDHLRWSNEQLDNELSYYKRKYGDAWESSTQ